MLPKGISMKLSSSGVLYPTKLPNLGDGTWFNGLKLDPKELFRAGVCENQKNRDAIAIKNNLLYGVAEPVFWLMLMLRSSEICKSSNFKLPKRTVQGRRADKKLARGEVPPLLLKIDGVVGLETAFAFLKMAPDS